MDDRKQETLEGIRLARLSAELGRDDAYALCAAGFALAFLGFELDAGVALIDQAVLLNSNLAMVWHTSGWVRIYIGEPEIAIAHLARAMRLSPIDPDAAQYAAAMSFALRNAGRYEESISWAEKALHERPNFVPALRSYAASSALAGRIVDAQRAMSVLLKNYPHRISDFPKGRLRRPEDYAKLTEGLRIAGMPE
jgi:tetratricopeptide (TPR) repeat protein